MPRESEVGCAELPGNTETPFQMRGCVVFTANRGFALSNSRKPLIEKFAASGWQVVLATSNDEHSRSLCGENVLLEPVVFLRRAMTPISDFNAYRRLAKIFGKYRPDLVQNYHIKPVVLGTIAAKRHAGGATKVVNTITGLGQAFEEGEIRKRLAALGYRTSGSMADVTVFQNEEDRAFFAERDWVARGKDRLVVSAGVDVERFRVRNRVTVDDDDVTVVMVTRLLRKKGVNEFVAVARRLREKGMKGKFLIAGEQAAGHPDGVSVEWLRAQDCIQYVGHVDNIVAFYQSADVLLFPSRYREGVPRVILEAAASGVPMVAFDIAGVRDVIQDGRTGFLVPTGDVETLAKRVEELIGNVKLRRRMGMNARHRVEKSFTVQEINRQYVRIYRELGLNIG